MATLFDDWTLNRQAERLVDQHMRTNPAVRRSRHSRTHRALRTALSLRFATLLLIYLTVDIAAAIIEVLVQKGFITPLISVPAKEVEPILTATAGVAITAQTGALAVITLALALVALVAQRDEAAGDTQIYYHHSMAFEISASCLALVVVLAVQSAWPLQVAAHAAFGLKDDVGPKFGLTLTHLAWLTLNVVGVARFVFVTLQFVQRNFRERMRMQYVVNAILKNDMRRRIRETLYRIYLGSLVDTTNVEDVPVISDLPVFGPDHGTREVTVHFVGKVRLADVWLPPLRWAVRSWWRRSVAAEPPPPANGGVRTIVQSRPRLRLPVAVGSVVGGDVVLCRRVGGLPMNRVEKYAMRLAMRFSAAQHAN